MKLKKYKDKVPNLFIIIIALLIIASILSIFNLPYITIGLFFLVLILIFMYKKFIKDLFVNYIISEVLNNKIVHDESKRFLNVIIRICILLFFIFTIIFTFISKDNFSLITNAATTVISICFISLIDVFFELYVLKNNKIINDLEREDILEKYKNDARIIKCISGILVIFILILNFLVSNITNELLAKKK